ncbi:hypothetical protein QQP08_008152 [Theobroma cacao]|nr:hypothetical protein QQP08_008152 [Theobroma cacao]
MPVTGEADDNNKNNSITHILSSKTPLFNLKLYVVISILVVLILLLSFTIFLCFRLNRNARKRKVKHSSGLIPLVSKEIVEIKALEQDVECFADEGKIGNVAPKKSSEGEHQPMRERDTVPSSVPMSVKGAHPVKHAENVGVEKSRWR